MVEPFQHLHPPARTGQVRRGDEAVVSAADDDNVRRCHRSAKIALDLVGRTHLGLAGIAAGLSQRPSLPQQIPALVECDLDGAQPRMLLRLVDLVVLQLGPQLLLLGD